MWVLDAGIAGMSAGPGPGEPVASLLLEARSRPLQAASARRHASPTQPRPAARIPLLCAVVPMFDSSLPKQDDSGSGKNGVTRLTKRDYASIDAPSCAVRGRAKDE